MNKQENALRTVYNFLECMMSNNSQVSKKNKFENGHYTVKEFSNFIQKEINHAKSDDLIISGDYTKEQIGCLYHLSKIEAMLVFLDKNSDLYKYYLIQMHNESMKGMSIID
ncbi:hypothetical protein [Alkalibacterium sp. 20]|uniref:hypothetical protein n=1 Tax=Alkalibacterium sp. 20 TaxID=1798803 RepID=UPI0009003D3C|nr:hypothetical protein [Alkalibacterium sp. 20]OJF90988.1 hypothetical protein AX762_11505 [Alkalibacterium sp. 20]